MKQQTLRKPEAKRIQAEERRRHAAAKAGTVTLGNLPTNGRLSTRSWTASHAAGGAAHDLSTPTATW